ncbi:MAG: hypothetical protein IIB88_04225, partial [Chloroflexi bacterium]|nr:hypothetical protein [Chloroflexota bacterium]
ERCGLQAISGQLTAGNVHAYACRQAKENDLQKRSHDESLHDLSQESLADPQSRKLVVEKDTLDRGNEHLPLP